MWTVCHRLLNYVRAAFACKLDVLPHHYDWAEYTVADF